MEPTTTSKSELIDIDELERTLRTELAGVQLIGEIDMDTWGVMAEEALRTRAHRYEPDKIRRLWPATLATYLVYQGLHAYEDSTFWRLVSIDQLRGGQDVGPEFERALDSLHLSSFNDLEALEGFSKHTRGRYIRRIHLHGGIPRDSVRHVMELLDSTLRSGASSAEEVVDLWYGLDLANFLHNKAAERCIVHARDFAVSLVAHLIELVRYANRSDLDSVAGVPSHLVAGVEEFIASDRTTTTWDFVEGARIRIDPHRGDPYLSVPEGFDVVWSINGDEVGVSSRRVRERFELPLPVGQIWTVESDDGERVDTRRFSTEQLPNTVLVFDERGRLHRRGATLGGIRAYVVARASIALDAVLDQRSLAGSWSGFELFTIDLRALEEVELRDGDAIVRIPIQNELQVRIARGPVGGVKIDGHTALSGDVTLAFDGFVPELDQVTVHGPGGSIRLSDAKRHYGEFVVTGCFDRNAPGQGVLSVRRSGADPIDFEVTYVPGLTFQRPRLAPPDGEVVTRLSVDAPDGSKAWTIRMPASLSVAPISVDLVPGDHVVEVEVNRLEWTLDGPHTLIPLVSGEGFSIRLDELHTHELRLKTNGVPARVALLDATVHHEETARRDRHRPAIRTSQIKAFAETARAAEGPRTRVVVLCDDEPPIEVGVIESRYEVTSIATDVLYDDDGRLLAVDWEEVTEWPNRWLQLWGRSPEQPVLSVPIQSGDHSALISLDELDDGQYLVEVAVRHDHIQARRPAGTSGCCHIFLGSESAIRLRGSVLAGDRKTRFDDEELDDLVPVLAQMLIEQHDEGATREQQLALFERIADDHWRFIDVVSELDDICSDDSDPGSSMIETYLINLLPLAWVNPIVAAEEAELTDQLEHLWQIAPIVAACLDRANSASPASVEECETRWGYYGGLVEPKKTDLARILDRLTAAIPARLQPVWGQVPPLSADAWAGALWELHSGDDHESCWAELQGHSKTALALSRANRKSHRPPPWVGVPLRVRNATKVHGSRCDWMSELVRLACELLEPTGAVAESDVLAALSSAYSACPQATRTAIVHAAAALRLLETAGPAARLMS